MEKVTVARVAKIFGTEGELTLSLFDTFPQDFNMSEPLMVTIDSLAVPLFCDRFQRRGRSGALVVFSDIYSERSALEFVGKELFMEFEPEVEVNDGRIYLEDMVGYRAIMEGSPEGMIADFIDGENPLFRIMIDQTEIYIPAVESFMLDINAKKKCVTFDLPDGLLDLYAE